MTDRPRAIFILVCIFLLGGIAGASVSYFLLKSSMNSRAPGFVGNAPPVRGPGRMQMGEWLQLTPEQEARFREIMAESRRKLGELQKEQMPKIEAIRTETNRKLLEILNQEQREKFQSFLKEWESRRGRMPGGRQFNMPPTPPPSR